MLPPARPQQQQPLGPPKPMGTPLLQQQQPRPIFPPTAAQQPQLPLGPHRPNGPLGPPGSLQAGQLGPPRPPGTAPQPQPLAPSKTPVGVQQPQVQQPPRPQQQPQQPQSAPMPPSASTLKSPTSASAQPIIPQPPLNNGPTAGISVAAATTSQAPPQAVAEPKAATPDAPRPIQSAASITPGVEALSLHQQPSVAPQTNPSLFSMPSQPQPQVAPPSLQAQSYFGAAPSQQAWPPKQPEVAQQRMPQQQPQQLPAASVLRGPIPAQQQQQHQQQLQQQGGPPRPAMASNPLPGQAPFVGASAAFAPAPMQQQQGPPRMAQAMHQQPQQQPQLQAGPPRMMYPMPPQPLQAQPPQMAYPQPQAVQPQAYPPQSQPGQAGPPRMMYPPMPQQPQPPPTAAPTRPMYPPMPPMQQQQQQQQHLQQPPQQQAHFTQPPGPGMMYPPLGAPQANGRPGAPPVAGGPVMQNGPTAMLHEFMGNFPSSGMEPVDLLKSRQILPPKPLAPPRPRLQADTWTKNNCSPDIFRCTMTKIPETDAILKKCRLPLGVLIHPFKDLSHLPVIQCSTIVRCRQCRTYINPFVSFVDQRRWRCNVCFRVNELPEEFMYDPVSKSYGDPSRRPECKSSTIEFIAPSEYMLRPPQPAVYVFLLDVSHAAVASGYLKVFCDTLLNELDKLPGDGRTQVAFITYDRTVHFYSMPENATQPTQLNVSDVDDMFLPSPSDLLVNLNSCRGLVEQLLSELPSIFADSFETQSALGAALQAAFKMASPTGGRITVVQCALPSVGPGALPSRETVNSTSDKKVEASLLGPATDFYKKMALDCSGQQVAVDLFCLGGQYMDIATLSGVSKFCGGQVQHFPGYHVVHNTTQAVKFENALRRYLTRKIGFEAVMRIRCTRGLTPHTFHGNFFVRSTDLLSLPNINPDAGFAMQVSIEEDLRESREVVFQAALLYTSSKAERRIRVHTLCLPTTTSVADVINTADQEAIVSMLAKFAAERAATDSVSDAKEGLVVSCVDAFETYKAYSSIGTPTGLFMSQSLRLLPLYVLATMRAGGFRSGQRLDDRSFCFSQFKTLPLGYLIQYIYPDLYRVDELSDEGAIVSEAPERHHRRRNHKAHGAIKNNNQNHGTENDDDGDEDSEDESEDDVDDEEEVLIPQPPRLQLSFEHVSAAGLYLLDNADIIYLFVCRGLHQFVLERIFGVTRLQDVDENLGELPELPNPESERLRTFIGWLNTNKPYAAAIKVIREDGKSRGIMLEKMVEDRCEGSFSYFEFLQHIKQQIK